MRLKFIEKNKYLQNSNLTIEAYQQVNNKIKSPYFCLL
jgi:hypothetical protein